MGQLIKIHESKTGYRVYADVKIVAHIEAYSEDEVQQIINAFSGSNHLFSFGDKPKDKRFLVLHIENISKAKVETLIPLSGH